ncbi:hypothetical protein QGN29_02845 [Temperatibacter marinus]|uniref:Uncharacterized protein n=1 Tax=Temperatibacter marinus TaxID=1456591 RepID=A0AA52H9L0_9PROT|nr:hypothetical protein [Temperatibacter marinus]WND03306.1 hypothetical protein QGN29_02845 [Temperatibacter marinus]
MTKSIEEIWQKGFDGNVGNLAPKVNTLYRKKTHNIIERLTRMYDYNVKGLVIAAILIAIVFPFVKMPILGFGIAILMLWLVYEAREPLAEIKALEVDDNCYRYILSFRNWHDKVEARFAKIYTLFYPILYLLILTQFNYSEVGEKVLNGLSRDATMIGSYPLSAYVVLVVGTGLAWIFGAPLYKLDIKIMYGRTLSKIDDLIEDMESLQEEAKTE